MLSPEEYNKALSNLGSMVGLAIEIDFEQVEARIVFVETLLQTVEKLDGGDVLTPELRGVLANQLVGVRQLLTAAKAFLDAVPKEMFADNTGEIPRDDDSTG